MEIELFDYEEKNKYKITFDDNKICLSSEGLAYTIKRLVYNQILNRKYNFLCNLFNFKTDYEFNIQDVNRMIISTSCEIMIQVDKYKNPIVGVFRRGYQEYMSIAIDDKLRPYVTSGCRRLSYHQISEEVYHRVLDISIKIFGEDLCRKSAFTYAQTKPVYEIEDENGYVTLTGEFFNGTKRPETGLFDNFFIHEKGFNFIDRKSYDIDKIPADEIYKKLNPTWKSKWKNLFLCMQPSGEWWISDGMEYDNRSGWKRYHSDVYFHPFDFFDINPVDNCGVKYYLSKLYTPEIH